MNANVPFLDDDDADADYPDLFIKEILEEMGDMDIENESTLGNYDENAITFFAGYMARRCIQKNNCDDCRATMSKTPMDDATSNEKYIEYREYPNADEDAPTVTKLVRPTSRFNEIIKTQLMAFNSIWQRHWSSTQILQKIVNEGMYATNKMYAGWFDTNEKCYNHRMQALKFLMTVKIYSRTRYNNGAAKAINTANRKLKNLSNK